MTDMLIRGLDEKTVKRLKSSARRHGRSLQKEAKAALENAAGTGNEDVAQMLADWKTRFAGRKFSRSVDIIRKDRMR